MKLGILIALIYFAVGCETKLEGRWSGSQKRTDEAPAGNGTNVENQDNAGDTLKPEEVETDVKKTPSQILSPTPILKSISTDKTELYLSETLNFIIATNTPGAVGTTKIFLKIADNKTCEADPTASGWHLIGSSNLIGNWEWEAVDFDPGEYFFCIKVTAGGKNEYKTGDSKITIIEPLTSKLNRAFTAYLTAENQLPTELKSFYREICRHGFDQSTCEQAGLLFLKDKLVPDFLNEIPEFSGKAAEDLGTGLYAAVHPVNGNISISSVEETAFTVNAIESITMNQFDLNGDLSSDSITIMGNGIPGKPYLIANILQLQSLAFYQETYQNAQIKLSGSIDASETTSWHSGKGFLPIPAFSGELDGDGQILSALKILRDPDTHIGLFAGITSRGIVRNLIIDGANVEGLNHVGILAAKNEGLIKEVTLTNSSITSSAGGDTRQRKGSLVGQNLHGKIFRCKIENVSVKATWFVGGVVGHLVGGTFEEVSAKNVTVFASRLAGGLIGHTSSAGKIKNSYVIGTMNGASPQFGGIGGLSGNFTNDSQIINSYASMIMNVPDHANKGGLVGTIPTPVDGFASSINSFWNSEVSLDSDSPTGIGRSSLQLKTKTDYPSNEQTDGVNFWDFENVWEISPTVNDGFPTLKFE